MPFDWLSADNNDGTATNLLEYPDPPFVTYIFVIVFFEFTVLKLWTPE